MNKLIFEDLIKQVRIYNPEEESIITKAYNYAKQLHDGQIRQSGETYISHPLNVAYMLSEMHADEDIICAGLLHDTLEDTSIIKEEIAQEFNVNIANLVDGVTKLSKINFSSKQEQNLANTREIITGITEDVRIKIIKLADRLHNMRTLSFKSELEYLSLKYLKPDMYSKIEEKKVLIENNNFLHEMLLKIQTLLNDKKIQNEIKVRTKNIYGLYKRISEAKKYQIYMICLR